MNKYHAYSFMAFGIAGIGAVTMAMLIRKELRAR